MKNLPKSIDVEGEKSEEKSLALEYRDARNGAAGVVASIGIIVPAVLIPVVSLIAYRDDKTQVISHSFARILITSALPGAIFSAVLTILIASVLIDRRGWRVEELSARERQREVARELLSNFALVVTASYIVGISVLSGLVVGSDFSVSPDSRWNFSRVDASLVADFLVAFAFGILMAGIVAILRLRSEVEEAVDNAIREEAIRNARKSLNFPVGGKCGDGLKKINEALSGGPQGIGFLRRALLVVAFIVYVSVAIFSEKKISDFVTIGWFWLILSFLALALFTIYAVIFLLINISIGTWRKVAGWIIPAESRFGLPRIVDSNGKGDSFVTYFTTVSICIAFCFASFVLSLKVVSANGENWWYILIFPVLSLFTIVFPWSLLHYFSLASVDPENGEINIPAFPKFFWGRGLVKRNMAKLVEVSLEGCDV